MSANWADTVPGDTYLQYVATLGTKRADCACTTATSRAFVLLLYSTSTLMVQTSLMAYLLDYLSLLLRVSVDAYGAQQLRRQREHHAQ